MRCSRVVCSCQLCIMHPAFKHQSPVTACLPLQDSMAMLRLLHDLSQQQHWPLRLVVGHCDHRVRPDSGEAAAHVQRFCETLGLPCKQAVADRQTGHWPEVCRMSGVFREPGPLSMHHCSGCMWVQCAWQLRQVLTRPSGVAVCACVRAPAGSCKGLAAAAAGSHGC